MQLVDLQARVRIALTNTIANEWTLFTPSSGSSSASERTIAFHLGWNLRPLVEAAWDIDAEYDRSGMVLEKVVKLEDDAAGRRIPDLIVHRRGRLGPEENLLILELTANHEMRGTSAGDFTRAQAIQRRFGYRYAVLLDLHLTLDADCPSIAPTWHWATLDGGPATIEPEAVYPPDVLRDFTERAARAAGAR
ncbi:MAG: hypothetical protein FWF28_00025 [Micrococcales bacterium]|nr:hypothetical protein [Micrococcales bacterium]